MPQNTIENTIDVPFAWLPQELFSDEYNLSARAVGILLYLNNRPDGWTFYKKDIVNRFSDGKTSIQSGLETLEEQGFLKRQKVRNSEGKWAGMKWTIRMPNRSISGTGESETGNSGAGTPASSKKECSKMDSSREEKQNDAPAREEESEENGGQKQPPPDRVDEHAYMKHPEGIEEVADQYEALFGIKPALKRGETKNRTAERIDEYGVDTVLLVLEYQRKCVRNGDDFLSRTHNLATLMSQSVFEQYRTSLMSNVSEEKKQRQQDADDDRPPPPNDERDWKWIGGKWWPSEKVYGDVE